MSEIVSSFAMLISLIALLASIHSSRIAGLVKFEEIKSQCAIKLSEYRVSLLTAASRIRDDGETGKSLRKEILKLADKYEARSTAIHQMKRPIFAGFRVMPELQALKGDVDLLESEVKELCEVVMHQE